MSYGYLASRPHLQQFWPYGRKPEDPYERENQTRLEEYHFAVEATRESGPGLVLDAACGWIGGWHILSHLVADELYNPVVALDANPDHLFMQKAHSRIVRMTGSLWALPFAEQSFQTTLCISVLEHLPNGTYQSMALANLCIATKGMLVITGDDLDPEMLADAVRIHKFDPGKRHDQPGDRLLNDQGDPICYLKAKRIGGWATPGLKILKKDADGTWTAVTTIPSTGCTPSLAS